MRKRCFLLQLNRYFLVFQSILGRLEGTRRLPRIAWSQIGNIELQGVIQGCPGTIPGGQKKHYPSARPQTVEELEALGLAIKPLNFPMKRLTQERK